jgi:pyruvate formate lyase activating enzyme
MNAADIAMRVRESGTVGIAYTYSEPFIWFETIMEVGRMVREQGQVNVMVTNGYMEPGPLAELLGVVDAMNIDIKSMDPAFYRRLCKGRLTPVLRACEQARKSCHLEITNLLIPGKNDSPAEVRELAAFVAANLGADTPLHLSRYFPRHRMDLPPTPQASLLQAYEIAREKLQYVYIGNSEAGDKANTYCPSCRALLVRRRGYQTQVTPGLAAAEGSKYAKCGKCGRETGIVVA